MAIQRTLYPGTGASQTTTEIDLRSKFDELVYGTGGKTPHGHWILIRRMRRDDAGVPEICVCKDPITRDATPGCPYCLGEGYLWDEEWAVTYSMHIGADGGLTRKGRKLQPGILRVDYKVFYLRYDVGLKYADKLVEVKLDTEGLIVEPFQRTTIYQAETIDELRADNGRIEYVAVYCREDDAIRSDYV